MARQLVLISPSEIDWQLDQITREVGRRGICEARAALRRSAPTDGAARGDDR
jgi:hypothetical protein